MKNEWIVVKYNHKDDSPNIGGSNFGFNHDRRIFRMGRKFLTVNNTFDDYYVPGCESFFWITHEHSKYPCFGIEESAGCNPI